MQRTNPRTRFLHLAVGLLVVVCSPVLGQARTWRVEKDGSGDFAAIQPAVDAAAAGDTVQIGVGRYLENAPFALIGSTTELTYVAISTDDLTIRGVDRDAVIIGPAVRNIVGDGPRGIVTQAGLARITIENLTVENVRDGMFLKCSLKIQNTTSRGSRAGLVAGAGATGEVQQSSFLECTNAGLDAIPNSHDLTVADCQFTDNWVGANFNASANGVLRNCVFRGGRQGAEYEQGASGTITSCRFLASIENVGVRLFIADVRLEGCLLAGGVTNLRADTRSHLTGAQNTLVGGSFSTMRFTGRSTADFHGNDILKGAGWLVLVEAYAFDLVHIGLQNNYWGIATAAEMATAIHDVNDDPLVHGVVDFEPFAQATVPAPAASFGSLKARYAQTAGKW